VNLESYGGDTYRSGDITYFLYRPPTVFTLILSSICSSVEMVEIVEVFNYRISSLEFIHPVDSSSVTEYDSSDGML
jgi:hypothetical protein